MMTDSLKAVSPGVERGWQGLLHGAQAVAGMVRAVRRASQERAQLLQMSERELHDMGISRIDAIQAVRRPLWPS